MGNPVPRLHDPLAPYPDLSSTDPIADRSAGPSRRPAPSSPVKVTATPPRSGISTSTGSSSYNAAHSDGRDRDKGKGKSREQGSRPGLVREVGSATISFRAGAAGLLESDEEIQDVEGGEDGVHRGSSRLEQQKQTFRDLSSVPIPAALGASLASSSPRDQPTTSNVSTTNSTTRRQSTSRLNPSSRKSPPNNDNGKLGSPTKNRGQNVVVEGTPSSSASASTSIPNPTSLHDMPRLIPRRNHQSASGTGRSHSDTRPSSMRTGNGSNRYPSKQPAITSSFSPPSGRSPRSISSNTAQRPSFQSTLLAPQTSHPQPRRRGRANSLHFPSDPKSTSSMNEKHFYLPHYSTDSTYSLEPSKKQMNFELGLGDDFDQSFGEAMRNGIGGAEMPLPQEALRVLSQAKENMDLRLVGKKGRKGSLGMGLFKESREGSRGGVDEVDCGPPGLDKKTGGGRSSSRIKEQTLLEEDEVIISSDEGGPLSPNTIPSTPLISSTPSNMTGSESRHDSIPIPITPSTNLGQSGLEDLSLQTAAISIVSSPLLRQSPQSRRRSSGQQRSHDSPHSQSLSFDDSGWTTTGSDESSTGLSEVTSRDSQSQEGHSTSDPRTSEDEGESMTVPLQPFDHAVGGHSSIYKFTRRAVCKVSLNPVITRAIACSR